MTMRTFQAGSCDIAVIGAGHAGIEAALAAARLGLETLCFTVNLDSVGNMPCNPAIGGTGKGHLVRELDALGGEMARAADKACIQYRMLNLGKGPAVHSLRAQADRRRYQAVMKQTLESQEHLHLRQAEIVSIGVEEGRVVSVTTHTGAVWRCRAVIVATGTYLDGRTVVGEALRREGPDATAHSPVMTRPPRYVPVAATTAFTSYTAPSCVTTCAARPPARRISVIIACFSSRRACRSSVRFISS